MEKVRLTWPVVSGAVQYQVLVLKDPAGGQQNIAMAKDSVFTNGVELRLSGFGEAARNFYWSVCPLAYDGSPIGKFSAPKPIAEAAINPDAPLPTTEFERMDYFPLYPVFSWVPVEGATRHEVRVMQFGPEGQKQVRRLEGGEYDVYETGGYTVPGSYAWQVRALTPGGEALSDWSEPSPFQVTSPTSIAALGDSITHGGGAMSVPPGYLLYDWETYSQVPVKNLGYSGDTTEAMLARFDADVLPFHPQVLVIMGGVNDFRAGTLGWNTVENLAAIRDKCTANGIIPVFSTVTPINPELIALRGMVEPPPGDWQVHQKYINDWVMQQPYHVDATSALADDKGNLRAESTTDGLHPDEAGKRHIGETIGKYLQAQFPSIAAN